jgi:copper chaperone CopZ
MKTLKFTITALLILCSSITFAKNNNENDTTVCFHVAMDCLSCKQKIEKNLAFEKGVKDLDVNFADKTVKIKYNKLKNSPELLKQAIQKLKYEVEIVSAIR